MEHWHPKQSEQCSSWSGCTICIVQQPSCWCSSWNACTSFTVLELRSWCSGCNKSVTLYVIASRVHRSPHAYSPFWNVSYSKYDYMKRVYHHIWSVYITYEVCISHMNCVYHMQCVYHIWSVYIVCLKVTCDLAVFLYFIVMCHVTLLSDIKARDSKTMGRGPF